MPRVATSRSTMRDMTTMVVTLWIAAAAGTFATHPLPSVAFILQMVGCGGVLGLLVASRARARNARADTWLIWVRWSIAGLVVGLLVSILDAATGGL